MASAPTNWLISLCLRSVPQMRPARSTTRPVHIELSHSVSAHNPPFAICSLVAPFRRNPLPSVSLSLSAPCLCICQSFVDTTLIAFSVPLLFWSCFVCSPSHYTFTVLCISEGAVAPVPCRPWFPWPVWPSNCTLINRLHISDRTINELCALWAVNEQTKWDIAPPREIFLDCELHLSNNLFLSLSSFLAFLFLVHGSQAI